MRARDGVDGVMDAGMGMEYRAADACPLQNNKEVLRVAIITGVAFASLTIPLSCLLAFCPKTTSNTLSNLI
jgi:hypothetical protein